MSFGDSLKSFGTVQEALVIGMVVTMFALFYVNIDLVYKIGIAALVFIIIVLVSIASQLLSLQKDAAKSAT
jgi:hypothetical protein